MPIQIRYAGDANGVNNFDGAYDGTLATIVSIGLTKSPVAFKITGLGTLSSSDSATGGIVEAVLRCIGHDSTITLYQVDSSQISVLVEACGTDAAGLQSRIRDLVSGGGSAVVSSANGFKLA